MEINDANNVISVHGRESLNIPYSRWTGEGEDRTQIDISGSTIFIEILAAHIRTQLLSDPGDALGLRIFLSRDVVEDLPTTPTPFIIVDETDVDAPEVEWEGRLVRRGYKGDPTDL